MSQQRCDNHGICAAETLGRRLPVGGDRSRHWIGWLLVACGILAIPPEARAEPPASGEPTPQWIWGTANASQSAPAGGCNFRFRFELTAPTAGKLRICCDNRYLLRLNGRLLGKGENWQQQDGYEVGELLRAGQNEILVIGANDDAGPAGLAVELEVEEAGQPARRLVTDGTWEAWVQPDGTWNPAVQVDAVWSPAQVLGPFGSASPWGRSVQSTQEYRAARRQKRAQDGSFSLQADDRVLFVGNALMERAQRFGYLEAALAAAFPDANAHFRNLGWSGDTVAGHARARFGTTADGFAHLETHVFAEDPTWIFVAYGTNEAFDGDAGLASFTQGLDQLLDVLTATGASLVLVTPPPLEDLGPPLPDPQAHNEVLGKYAEVIRQAAEARGCLLVDLYSQLLPTAAELNVQTPLTDNGMHLEARGYWCASQVFLRSLGLPLPRAALEVDAQAQQALGDQVEITELQVSQDRIGFTARTRRRLIAAPEDARTDISNLRISHLPPGQYQLLVDGHHVVTASADDWAAGIPLSSADRRQTQPLLQHLARKNELYFHRWRPQNETYLFLFRKHEQGNNAAEIPQFDPFIDQAELAIGASLHPAPQRFELVRQE